MEKMSFRRKKADCDRDTGLDKKLFINGGMDNPTACEGANVQVGRYIINWFNSFLSFMVLNIDHCATIYSLLI